MKLYLAIILILTFIVLLQILKNNKQKFTNYIKNSDIIDNINLKDSIIHIGSNPTDECIKRNSTFECLADNKCRVRERLNPQNSLELIKECVSKNDVNIEADLIVNNHFYIGNGMSRRKIDINTLRRIKNMPVHFNNATNINDPQETICLTNGSLDLPRCVQDNSGNFYIKLRGKDETSDHGYDATKDCKYKIQNSDNKTNIDNDDFNSNNRFKSLVSCNKFLKDNYNNIKNANTTATNTCGSNSTVTKTDTNYSCIQKHHIEMLNGKRPISLRTFASILPFTFFIKRFNEPPYVSRGLDDNPDFDIAPPTNKGPMSVNISQKYKLIAYSQPNYRGTRKTYRFPGVKDVSRDMPNGIRSYKVEHDTTPTDKLKHICLTRADKFKSANTWNATPSKKSVYIPEPCSYDNPYQMFYMDFEKGKITTDEHEHPHFHKGNQT